MKRLLAAIITLGASCACAAEAEILTAEQWASPRQGQSVAAMPPLAGALEKLRASPRGVLSLHHSGGDEGVLWAQELRAWLIALGVESRRIELDPGNPREDIIEMTVKEVGGNE